MTKTNQNMTLKQGTDKGYPLVFKDEDGDPVDLTGYYLKWVLYDHVNDVDLMKDTTGGGIVIDEDPLTGLATLNLSKADTQSMTPDTYRHEMRFKNAALKEDIFFVGVCTIEESLTL